MEGGGGCLPRPEECDGVTSEKAWALLGEERRRMVIDTLHRTEADNVERPLRRFDEFHFSPVSPGLGFKAMVPSAGYWEAVRRQREEDARRQEEEDARRNQRLERERRQMEELLRRQREDLARRQKSKDATLLRATQSTTDNQGLALAVQEMDLSNNVHDLNDVGAGPWNRAGTVDMEVDRNARKRLILELENNNGGLPIIQAPPENDMLLTDGSNVSPEGWAANNSDSKGARKDTAANSDHLSAGSFEEHR